MIIHLAGSDRNIGKDYAWWYQAVVRAIAECGGELADERRKSANEALDSHDIDWKVMFANSTAAIGRADLVIIEASAGDYVQGYETAIALQQKKPTLVVSHHRPSKTPASGLRSRLLSTSHYKSKDELVAIVKGFIAANTIATKDLRFNMFIDRPIYNYLRSVSDDTGKNKSEIIRELINREIHKQKD